MLAKPITIKYRNASADAFLTEMIGLKNELSAVGNNFNQMVKRLHTLSDSQEVKAWAFFNESSKQILLQKGGRYSVKKRIKFMSNGRKNNHPRSISRALNYNEQKVKAGKAECLCAGNFLKEANELNFYQKLERFEHQNALNQRAKTNTLHISLNFDAADKLSGKISLKSLVVTWKKLVLGSSPILCINTMMQAILHLHIVTTSIQTDGSQSILLISGKMNQKGHAKNLN